MHSPAPRTHEDHTRGVTFVELLVTLAIFSAVTAVLLGSFLALFSVREQTSVAQQANDDIRVVLDGIDREIQAGNNIEVLGGGSQISFVVSSRGDATPYPVRYRQSDGAIQKAVGSNEVVNDPCRYDTTTMQFLNADACFLPITGENIRIDVLNFSVETSEEEQEQASPLVTLSLSGVVKDSSDNVAPLTHSTSITPRNRVTVSDVEPAPPSPAPIATLVNIGNHLPAGCRVSENAYLPIDGPETPPDNLFYTNCSQINLTFTVNPGSAGLHSLRYTAPGSSAIKYGTGETGVITVQFNQDSGDARRLVVMPGTNSVSFSAENLYGDRYSGTFEVVRIGGTQCWNWLDDDGDGRIDYGGANPDPDCSSASDNDEQAALPPSVTLGAGSTNLTAGQSTTLTWSSTNATTCTASGSWVGLKGTSGGPQTTGVLPAGTYTYTLTCTGPGGSDDDSVVIVVGPVGGTCTIGPLEFPEPLEVCSTTEVQIFFGPPPYQACPPEGSVVPSANFPSGMCIDYTTPGPGTCYTTYHYRLCGGAMVNTAPSANAGPDQNWSAGTVSTTLAGNGNDPEGGALTYLWLKDSGPAVTISGAGTPNPTISGLTNGSIYVFRLRVTDAGGLWGEDTVTVRVGVPGPTVSFDVNPSTVVEGGNVTLTWSSTDATACTAGGVTGWTGAKTTSGSQVVNMPTEGTYDFTLHCTGAGGTSPTQTRTVTVTAPIAVCPATVKTWGGAPLCSGMVPNTSAGNSFIATDGAPDPQGSAVFTCLAGGIWSGASGATCASAVNTPPSASAGPDQPLPAGTVSTSLAGSGSDAEGPVTFSWSRIAGPAMTFANPSLPNTSVSGLTNGSSYTFRLTVTDTGGLQRSDDVTVTVGASAPPPSVSSGCYADTPDWDISQSSCYSSGCFDGPTVSTSFLGTDAHRITFSVGDANGGVAGQGDAYIFTNPNDWTVSWSGACASTGRKEWCQIARTGYISGMTVTATITHLPSGTVYPPRSISGSNEIQFIAPGFNCP